MPVTRFLVWVAPVAVGIVVFAASFVRTVAAPDPSPPEPPPREAPGFEVEVKCIDESTLKLKLLDEKLEFVTKYGFLQIPVADVRKIEFANRCPADVAEKIAVTISKLGHADFQVRERASAELKAYRERAYPYLLKATKADDPEVSRRADEAVKFILSRVPQALLQAKDLDVIYTDDCKITGKLTARTLRVQTVMFGEQVLRFADMRALRSGSGSVGDEAVNALPGPVTLATYQQQYGKELVFSVKGFTATPGQQSSVWGTDLYTLDSNLAAAVVHAGLAKPGEVVIVRVRIVQSPPQFVASFRNGITSVAYANFPAGAYEFVQK